MAHDLVGQARKRLRDSTRMPRQLRPTRAGWAFLLIIMGVGFAALNTGNNLLYVVLSLLLAFLVLSGVLSESALRGIEVRRTLPREIFAATGTPLLIEIRNNQRRIPAFAVRVEDLGEVRSAALEGIERPRKKPAPPVPLGGVFALRIGPESVEARSYPLNPPHRGDLHLHGVRVSTRFPFGLFSKSRTIEIPESTLVYPAIFEHAAPPRHARSEDRADSATTRRGEGSDVASIREYSAGDPLRRIHWGSSLRRDALFVRDPEEEHNAEVIVRLRTEAPGGRAADSRAAHDDFEERVSRAASEVVVQLEAGLRVGLVTDHEHLHAGSGHAQRARLLSLLARVEPRPVERQHREVAADRSQRPARRSAS